MINERDVSDERNQFNNSDHFDLSSHSDQTDRYGTVGAENENSASNLHRELRELLKRPSQVQTFQQTDPMLDQSDEGGLEQFFRSAAYTAWQAPIEGASQLINQTFKTNWEPPDFVYKPVQDTAWAKAGQFVGTLADFAVISALAGGTVAKLGLAGSTAAPMLSGALSGALYGGILPVPSDGATPSDYWKAKARNVAILSGTFATMAGAAQLLGSSAWLGETGKRSFLQDVALGGFSGAPAGAANAELGSLLDGKGWAKPQDLFSRTMTYGAFGAALGAINHGVLAAKEELDQDAAKTWFDRSGRLVKIPADAKGEIEISYDHAGRISQVVRTDGPHQEIMRAARSASGEATWTIEAKSYGETVAEQPWEGTVALDDDGQGVTIDGMSSTTHLRTDAQPVVRQTLAQMKHANHVKPAWDDLDAKFKAMLDPQGAGTGAGVGTGTGAGVGVGDGAAAAAGLAIMGRI